MPRRVYGIYRSASVSRLPDQHNQSVPVQMAMQEKPISTLSRSQSLSQIPIPDFGHAGATYVPFCSFSAVKPSVYRTNPFYSLRSYMSDKYYYFSHRYKRTQFHRHYYHGNVENYPYKWNFQSRGTITGQYYYVRRLQFDPVEYGVFRYYDPYRRYYDPYYDSYLKLYDYRQRLMDSLY